jgi:hypothetical protein
MQNTKPQHIFANTARASLRWMTSRVLAWMLAAVIARRKDRSMFSREVYHVRSGLLSLLLASALCGQQVKRVPSTREFFYVGGKYSGDVMSVQMYVEALRPARVTRKYRLVFFHGNSQTATNWMGTPDGRPGWADYAWPRVTSSILSINLRADVPHGIRTRTAR